MNRGSIIRISSLYVRLVQSGGMEAALQAMQQDNVRIGVLQEAKLTRGIHMCYIAG